MNRQCRRRREAAAAVRERPECVRGADAQIVSRRPETDVVEAFVDDVAVAIPHRTVQRRRGDAPHRRIGELGQFVAIGAPDVRGTARAVVEQMRPEQRQPADVGRAGVEPWIQIGIGRGRILASKPVPRCVVRYQRRFVDLHRQPEEQREVVLNQRVLVGCRIIVRPGHDRLRSIKRHRDQAARMPPAFVKRQLDHVVVVLDRETWLRKAAQRAKHAVGGMDLLLSQGAHVLNPLEYLA